MKNQPTLQHHYFQEAVKTLIRIKTHLQHLEQYPQNKDCYRRIFEEATSIADLAMIHGYDGVENIAAKIACYFGNLIRENKWVESEMVHQINQAINMIPKVAESEAALEENLTIERISRDAEASQKEVRDIARSVTDELAVLNNETKCPAHQKVTVVDEEELEFDIREFDSVDKIVNKFKKENSTITSA